MASRKCPDAGDSAIVPPTAMCIAAASPMTTRGKKNERASQRQPTRHCSDRLNQRCSPPCPPAYLTRAIAAILGPKLPAMNSTIPKMGN
ncbi:hypothetical protein [Spirulina sp. 06S082]|uniref:hypothetical protein n=1 Tax=Spirulina sp. 06S082 TaxID=3110248 RepID=UPI002B211E45|nr:hypothetical protein [Spirulina sp. 06S082]MEA5471947.1 hypothetical protein [Spirulina sp. 06S082]